MSSHSYQDDEPTDNSKGFGRILALALFLIALALSIAATSCNPVKRIGGLSAKHPDAALVVCSRMFPAKIDTVTRFDYIEGQTVTNYDTLTIDCDSVLAQSRLPGSTVRTKFVRVPCPPNTVRVDTVIKTVTITTYDVKQVKLLTKERDDAIAKGDKLKKGRNNWRWIGIGGIALLVAGFILKLKKLV